ncbi:TetR/AcrR family transcriptional regulator [Aeromicrobium piscarium]|uniref:TetR family transcriptional regulator n=1 Tax=Aeromicrobium piscarium TaxID=2590901 RepID=A0A554S906_9ACTN|nr:TetR family transcriptional regulator [Aeromicrobium piscarium]TSD62793.1 TetR family transcriptional regulator [Aeromicrobium piscarium]
MSYWDHVRPVRRTRAVAIGELAREAGRLLDEGGVDALTVRALAGRMGVAPASLYSRVESADDLLDLALDHALADDVDLQRAMAEDGHRGLYLAYYRHLRRHPWAPRVIGLRAPRGPAYLRLSERFCELLEGEGVDDPLTMTYAMSNFVIGSAATDPIVESERDSPIDVDLAPVYARLHMRHEVDAEAIVAAGLRALRDLSA